VHPIGLVDAFVVGTVVCRSLRLGGRATLGRCLHLRSRQICRIILYGARRIVLPILIAQEVRMVAAVMVIQSRVWTSMIRVEGVVCLFGLLSGIGLGVTVLVITARRVVLSRPLRRLLGSLVL